MLANVSLWLTHPPLPPSRLMLFMDTPLWQNQALIYFSKLCNFYERKIKYIGHLLVMFYIMNIFFLLYLYENPNNHHTLKFHISWNWKSLNNSQLFRFYHMSILNRDIFNLEWFIIGKNSYSLLFLKRPVDILDILDILDIPDMLDMLDKLVILD